MGEQTEALTVICFEHADGTFDAHSRTMTKKSNHQRSSQSRTLFVGYDASGHIAAREAQYLLDLADADRTTQNDEAFVSSGFTDDDLAEELAEAAVLSMTTGQDELGDQLQATVDEDRGGPFVETSANLELAGGTDESNIATATREPFPTPNGIGKT